MIAKNNRFFSKTSRNAIALLGIITLTSCSSSPKLGTEWANEAAARAERWQVDADWEYVREPAQVRAPRLHDPRRGSPAEYDPGPSKNSEWPTLFAETPNYRAYGEAIYRLAAKNNGVKGDSGEKFRWKVGPMWYRGRLSPDSVKVFVVGQEGAQDENTSNRTFTGSTGTKMQNFINYFGVNQSYLFMNTFTYTITGQYGERPEPGDSAQVKKEKEVRSRALMWLAQDPASAVVQHRHKMFNYMLSQNRDTVRLIIGVGSAGKDSVATWIRSHGGNCTTRQLTSSFCDASAIGKGVIAIGVRHPGAASARNGGSSAAGALQGEFVKKAELVANFIKKDRNWMPADRGMQPDFSKSYVYRDAPIPYRDFAFGTNWRMGKDGTASNRRGAEGIQIYSDNGCYNNVARLANGRCDGTQPPARPQTLNITYDEPADLQSKMDMTSEDVPWESPKNARGRLAYDQGPGEFAPLLMGVTNPWPDFSAFGVTQHPSFGTGAIYRGDLTSAKILVLADQESNDDLFSGRALTGTGGQRFQTFLNAVGAGDDYAIIRTLPVDTIDLSVDKAKTIATNPMVASVRNEILKAILKKGRTQLILAVGPVAQEAIKSLGSQIPVINMDSPMSSTHTAQWNQALNQIGALRISGLTGGKYDGSLTAIPRADLPVHTRYWMGTSGSRAARAYVRQGSGKVWNGDYYKFDAPTWVNARNYPADPNTLSASERSAVSVFSNVRFDLASPVDTDGGASAE